MRRLGFVLAIAVSLLVIAAVGAAGASWLFRDTETVRYSVEQPVERVVVDGAGDIQVVAEERDGIAVERTTTSFIDDPDGSWRVVNGVLRIENSCGRDWAFFAHCGVDFDIAVPAGLPLEIDSKHGDVDLRGSFGDLRIDSEHGDVDVDLGEPVTVETRSDHGDVDVTVPAGNYRVQVATEHGDTSVEGIVRDPAAAHAIVVDARHGDVSVRGR